MGFKKCKIAFWIIFGIVHVVVAIALLVSAFEFVSFGQYGLNYDSATGILYPGTLTSGRYFLGLSHKALIFPSLIQRIEYTDGELGWYTGDSIARQIQVRTTDGVAVIFYINFEYHLVQNELHDLIQTFGTGYQDIMVEVVSDVLRSTGSNFTSVDFYQNRQMVRNVMARDLAPVIRGMGSILDFFMFGLVDLPPVLETTLEQVSQYVSFV